MKILRVEDDVHAKIVELARDENRTISGYLNHHFRAIFNKKLDSEAKAFEEKVEDLIKDPEYIMEDV